MNTRNEKQESVSKTMLKEYCDWILARKTENGFYRCVEGGTPSREWYMIFYPARALLYAYDILGDKRYLDAVIQSTDLYLSEQLPNGGFTSNFRQQPAGTLSKAEFQDILRNGKVNLADNGSNLGAVIQTVKYLDPAKKIKYIDAIRSWFDNWVSIWALPGGGYGNGIWVGHKVNTPYTMAMSNVATAFSMFYQLTGEDEYRVHAEDCMRFQCRDHWLPDGRPVNLSVYPLPSEYVVEDYSRIFYLLEGLCWTHRVTKDDELKSLIAKRLKEWIFSTNGILSQWRGNWFNFNPYTAPESEDSWKKRFPALGETEQERDHRRTQLPSSRMGIRLFWELAKSCGILYGFSYYLNQIEEDPQLRAILDQGVGFLCRREEAKMAGAMSDPETSYGQFAVQATGFAGLSLAEASKPGVCFD